MCKVCRARGRKAAGEFCFKDVKLECVCKFAYLGDMLNDTDGVEQAVAARVRADLESLVEYCVREGLL